MKLHLEEKAALRQRYRTQGYVGRRNVGDPESPGIGGVVVDVFGSLHSS